MSEVGIIQMEHLAERLHWANIGAIYSSDLKRSVKGAQIIARHHDVPFHIVTGLREMNFGDWEGLPLAEIRERFPGELKKRAADLLNYQVPGEGESLKEVSKRVMNSFQSILESEEGNDILLVAHGVVNRVILCDALGLDLIRMFNFHQNYGCLNVVDYFPDSTLVKLING